ncbi:MAG: restriction endonuclease subunit S [Rhodospirillales bacterium]|nr:restriction endonuclease subunit S [Rhodospirillales bacterium]
MREGWKLVRLGDVCDFSRGLTYKKNDEVEFSSNVVLRANNISLDTGVLNFDELKYIRDDIDIPENKKLQSGSLLICTASGSKKHLGKIAFIDSKYDYAFGGFMGLLKPTKQVHAKYLYWVTVSNSYSNFIAGLSDGANINNLKFSQLSEFTFPLPPLGEQKRITAILDEAFEGIATATANAKKNLANARELFSSYLNSVFVENGKSWVEKTLGSVCGNLDSKRIPITKSKRKRGDIPYYGASGVVDHVADHIFDEELLLVSEDGANLLARTYPIAFSIRGKTWVNNHAHVLRFSDLRSQRFIEYYLNSISLEPYVSGMAQPKLNQKSLNSIIVPFPEVGEQGVTVDKLDEISAESRRLEAIYQQKLAALAELRQSLLQKAFAGELTAKVETAIKEEAYA